MKFQNILLLLTACLLAGSCSDDDNDGAWFLPRTLQVMDAKTDELRAKVDLARERMDQLRESLNEAIAGGNVSPAADVVVETAAGVAPAAEAPAEA